MIRKILIASVLILVLAVCLFSGCLGDRIVGTWNSDDTNTTVTFDRDGSYVAKVGLFEMKGTWEKSDNGYALYYQNVRAGSAVFEGSKLRISLGSGLLSISGTFSKA
ncbi:MAG: hypothetical protein LBE57_06025 [Methanosarcinales archaeon]|nr:hypothetical protein [Methanosarcinales archaeon]